jgi:hypothetical protein
LYKQVLVSIRLNIPSQNIRYQIREQIDFALYNKGLYKQSLKIDKTKIIALENDEKYMALVEFEKLIESQYIREVSKGVQTN